MTQKIAKQSWNQAIKFYRNFYHAELEKFEAFNNLLTFIANSQNSQLLYASHSHSMLNISPHMRYDAKVNVIRVGLKDGYFSFSLFSFEEDKFEDNVTRCKVDDFEITLEHYFIRLLPVST